MKCHRVAVIGSGMAGLACARALSQHGIDVRLFDKGRGPGGRMSTRRVSIGDLEVGFDHGAQYFTARDPEFSSVVTEWEHEGVVARWPAAGEDAWVGTPAMNAPIARLSTELDVRFSTRIDHLGLDGKHWRLIASNLPEDSYDKIVVAVPAEQVPPLVREHNPAFARAASLTPSAPCWTVMAAFESPVSIEGDVLLTISELSWAARNGAKPGRAPIESWILQASPDWSRTNRLLEPSEVIAAMLGALGVHASQPLPGILFAQAHSWLYARSGRYGQAHLWDPTIGLGVCGDWLLGARVECAWLSGRSLAASIIQDIGV